MNFGLKPLGDKIIVKRTVAEAKTASGIVLPGSAKEMPNTAEVVAVGPGTEDIKMEIKVGETVILPGYGGVEVKYMGEKYLILSQLEVLAVVE
ncbi:MAG: co-chaperone GroES [Anaerovoracaceae bacterium]